MKIQIKPAPATIGPFLTHPQAYIREAIQRIYNQSELVGEEYYLISAEFRVLWKNFLYWDQKRLPGNFAYSYTFKYNYGLSGNCFMFDMRYFLKAGLYIQIDQILGKKSEIVHEQYYMENNFKSPEEIIFNFLYSFL